MSQPDPRETAARRLLRNAGYEVVAVPWVERSQAGEFAALVARTPQDWAVIEKFLADPRCVLRETARTSTRVTVRFA